MEVNYYIEEGLLRYVIDGVITVDDTRELQIARDKLAANKTIKVLAIVTSFKGYESLEAFKNAIYGDIHMLPKLSKYAMLTDSFWLSFLVAFLNSLMCKSKLKAFSFRDRNLAESWLD
ncbi:STAS/SEC14 domain-containing protein [Algoriphagus winogradskyi]|uniref:SpoIIAA-like n=1 Tax=Algoriphagus winogradskyi TaxID=237017 RepID=A0ABY1NYE9_9BACT|nr:STAS/SEC14 domain-containing protein [Algoriphagus winogradskyi]SMP22005.1 SpoIIAA-like [Algoriphagus winogradskyi]